MGIFDRFPYSSTHEMNLDFMLGKATEIAEDMQQVTAGMAQVQAGLSAISEKTEQATQAAAQAAASASSIEGSVTAAEEAAEEAQTHNESAQTWANNALTYKADCQRAATEAAASSSSAAQAATAAAASEDTVATYAQAANASAQSAANNNDSAHQYANQASASASNATFHSSNAQTAATNAQTAATNANTSATNASASADRAAYLKTDVETLHRMCVAAVDQAATEAVNAANSAAQAAATKTDVENLVESLPEDFTDLNNTVNQLSDEIVDIKEDIGVKNVEYTYVSGEYISKNGVVATSAPFSHTNPFSVSNGDLVIVKAMGYLTEVAMIATCNSDLSNISVKVQSIDNTNRIYTYLCESDGYVVVSYNTAAGCDITLNSAESNVRLDSRLTAVEDAEKAQNALVYDSRINILADSVAVEIGQSGKYVNKNGTVSNSNNFYISSPIAMQKGQTIRFNCKGYLTEVAMLASVENGVYTPIIVSADNDEHILTYTCMVDMNVVISCIVTVTSKYSMYASQIGLNNARITALEHDFVAFATMGVIGDSLASGASNYSGGASDRPAYAWGKFIEKEHGIMVSLFSFGGATTRQWLSDSRGATALSNANVLDCYVIGLGVNDAYSLGADYLGSIADIHVGSESDNADSYYGNYSKIIAAIKMKSPRAKIFCLTNPKGTSDVRTAYNEAIRNIVSLYANTYLIDLLTDSFYTSDLFNNTWYSAHSTALGYKLIGANLYAHISEIIQNHISEFTDIQWIVENHP